VTLGAKVTIPVPGLHLETMFTMLEGLEALVKRQKKRLAPKAMSAGYKIDLDDK
jgi:hypothetical protein